MKIYLATGAREYLMLLLLCGVKQILVSFEYPEPYQCKRLLERHEIKLMIDSGAFSSWSRGKKVNIDEYIEFIKQNAEVIDKERIVNLDIILGGNENLAQGQKLVYGMKNKSSKEDFEEACKKGFDNYYYIKEKLSQSFDEEIFPIHVFHQGDDFKWLEKMLKECKYIGISPNNDESEQSKDNWLMECFKMIGSTNIKTHAFGVTSERLLSKFPYTTADSSSYSLTAAFGSILTPFGRFLVSEESKHKVGHIDQQPLHVRQKLEEYLQTFGFTLNLVKKKYKYRNIVNIFHYLDLEKKIHEQGHTFNDYLGQQDLFSRKDLENNIL